MRRASSLARRTYHRALHLYPPAFRREFGSELRHDFDDACDEAWGENGWRGLPIVWMRTASDLLASLVRQWVRTGLPAIGLVAAGVALSLTGAVAQLIPRGPLMLTLDPADRELMALLLLAGTVLLVIATTIVFTLWFLRPRPRTRPRR